MIILVRLFSALESGIRKVKNRLQNFDPQQQALSQWYKEDPRNEKRHRFDHLTASSIVFDLGGYLGDWTADIYSRYCCNVHVFEPVKRYADLIRDRFRKNSSIQVHEFGLGTTNSTETIVIDEFASRISDKHNNKETESIKIKEFVEFTNSAKIQQIDLIKINIEGAEFDLLDHLIEKDKVKLIKGFLIQFHPFVKNADERRKKIQTSLSHTHKKIFDYPFVWEYWQVK